MQDRENNHKTNQILTRDFLHAELYYQKHVILFPTDIINACKHLKRAQMSIAMAYQVTI